MSGPRHYWIVYGRDAQGERLTRRGWGIRFDVATADARRQAQKEGEVFEVVEAVGPMFSGKPPHDCAAQGCAS